MELSGDHLIAATPEVVWARLLDPVTLMLCVPGLAEVSGDMATGYNAVIKRRIGPLPLTIRGVLHLVDVVPGVSYTILTQGSGGLAGSAAGRADVRMLAVSGGTLLIYRASANVGGRLAKLGEGILRPLAQSAMDRFFDRFAAVVTGQ